MKTKCYLYLLLAAVCLLSACQKEFELRTTIVELGALTGPVSGSTIAIDPENGSSTTLTWTPAKSADGGVILYRVLFDKEGADFSNPVYTLISDNRGGATTLTISPAYLNVIAASAGIEQLTTGKVIWTVQASSAFESALFPEPAALQLTRPEGLAIFPPYMYIYGSATEADEVSKGIAFKELVNELSFDNYNPGIFESITSLKEGEYFITDYNNADSTINYYYLNEDGKIRSGNQSTTFSLPEGVYRIRMNLSGATISFEKMTDMELYIFANGLTKANLTYVGNHTFEASNGNFPFLTPGAPEAPDWLGWEEERYRFRFMLDGVQNYIGSYHTEDMNSSLVAGRKAFNARPNGDEPEGFYHVYFHGDNPPFWQGAWKFADVYNGKPFTVRIVFDPKAPHYYHAFSLN